jgi:hypothetical protein
MELIERQALLKQIDIDSDGEPGYYGDTWKFIDTIKSMPSAIDTNVGAKLGANLAEAGTDLATKRAVKGFPIDADLLMLKVEEEYGFRARDRLYGIIRNMPKYELPPAQSEIIYCKDCKYWCEYWNSGSCEYPEHIVNSQDYMIGDIETDAKHFCGYAERKVTK